MGPSHNKKGEFWKFKKSLLGNGRPLAGIDRINVQVGAPSIFRQGRSRLDPGKSKHLIMWSSHKKEGDFWKFKKSLL